MTRAGEISSPAKLLVTRSRRVVRAVLMLLPVLAIALGMFRATNPVAGPLLFSWLAAALAYSGVKNARRELPTETVVHVRDGALTLLEGGASTEIRREDVRRAYAEPHGAASRLVVETGARTYEIELADPGAARAMLRAMRLSALDRPLTFSFFFGLRVTVGADGVLVAWPLLRRARFVAHREIARVEAPDRDTVVLVLHGGRRYTIHTRPHPRQQGTEQAALLERLTDAWEAYRAGVSPDALGLLARAGRDALDWVRQLRALGDGRGGGYRGIGLTPDHLFRIAEDPSAPRETRVGAALALRGALDDEGRARLRIAAEASAAPQVRVALAAAVEEPDDEAVAARIEGQIGAE